MVAHLRGHTKLPLFMVAVQLIIILQRPRRHQETESFPQLHLVRLYSLTQQPLQQQPLPGLLGMRAYTALEVDVRATIILLRRTRPQPLHRFTRLLVDRALAIMEVNLVKDGRTASPLVSSTANSVSRRSHFREGAVGMRLDHRKLKAWSTRNRAKVH